MAKESKVQELKVRVLNGALVEEGEEVKNKDISFLNTGQRVTFIYVRNGGEKALTVYEVPPQKLALPRPALQYKVEAGTAVFIGPFPSGMNYDQRNLRLSLSHTDKVSVLVGRIGY